jgi:hypothetical protein
VIEHRAIVAIINYNTREELRVCLDSLRPNLDRVVVFDNGSTDGSTCEQATLISIAAGILGTAGLACAADRSAGEFRYHYRSEPFRAA